MADEISFQDFQVDLAAMEGVIGQVKGQAGAIEGAMAEIKLQFAAVETAWRSPSAFTFTDLSTWFDTCQTQLTDVLADMTGRLDAAYATYHDMETANLAAMDYTANPPGPGGDDTLESKRLAPREDATDGDSRQALDARLAAQQSADQPMTELTARDSGTADTPLTMMTAREGDAPTQPLSRVTGRVG